MNKITVNCPEMPVLSTSWWNPFAKREAQELDCTGVIEFNSEELNQIITFSLVFPKCFVRWQWFGSWLVDKVTANGNLSDGGIISITLDPEPVKRDWLKMLAQPVDATVSAILGNGKIVKGKMVFPLATGNPVGWIGWREYKVEAVEATGTVEIVDV